MSDPARRYQREFDAIMREAEDRAGGAETSRLENASDVQWQAIPESPASREPTEPRGPQPEGFGLTPEQVQAPDRRLPKGIVAVLVVLAIVAYAAILKRMGLSLWWLLFAFPIGLYPVGLISACFATIASSIAGLIRRSDRGDRPDPVAYQRYLDAVKLHQNAMNSYRKQVAEWHQAEERRRKSQVAYWQSLSGRDFERELANLLRERGYQVQLTPTTNDGGVDLMLARGGQRILVQCKAHKTPVGPGPVRDLFGTFTHHGGSEAWLISLSGFTNGARTFARGKRVRLVTLFELLDR